MVARRQVGVVVDRDRVLAEPARGLHHDHDVLADQGGEDDRLLAGRVVEEHLARRRAPVLLDALAEVGGQGREPGGVLGGVDADRVGRHLLLGQPVLVVPAGGDQGADQQVAVVLLEAGDGVLGEPTP